MAENCVFLKKTERTSENAQSRKLDRHVVFLKIQETTEHVVSK